MVILSIYTGHNASVAIMRNSKVLLNIELERFTRIKHDYGYRQDFIDECLKRCKLTIDDVDHLIFKPWDCGMPSILRKGTIINPCDMEQMIPSEYYHKKKVTFMGKEFDAYNIDHHLCHAASAFFTSEYERSLIFTFDGGGDNKFGSLSIGYGNNIYCFSALPVPNIAGWWSGITLNNYRMPRIHEWDPGSGAGKIMALAAYGNDNDVIVNILKKDIKNNITSRSYTDKYGVAYNNDEDMSDTTSQKSKDLAYALQKETEDLLSDITDTIKRMYPDHVNLCYAGGIALNCVANSKVLDKKFNSWHVPPFPNDTGIAIGAALYLYYNILNNKREIKFFSPYTGFKYTKREIASALKRPDIYTRKVADDEIAFLLANKNIVFFYNGQSESGPRALGNRSILCHPGIPGIREKINDTIKFREWYRPYAPVVMHVAAHLYLDCFNSPYMTTNHIVRETFRETVSGICHVDHSTRPQVLEQKHNPRLYNIIYQFQMLTGIPMLLNTSFNCMEPIVETPEQAIDTFLKMPEGYLVIDDNIIVRK
jgi:carbamoyltransferase